MKKALILAFFFAFSSSNLFAQENKTPVETSKPAVKKMLRQKKKAINKSSTQQEKATETPKSSVKLENVQTTTNTKSKESFVAWLTELKNRISKTKTKQNQLIAVAAVRGDEKTDVPPLFWIGEKAKGKVANNELDDFESAITMAGEGDGAVGREKLKSFISAYPKSSLKDDAQETLNRLNAASEMEP